MPREMFGDVVEPSIKVGTKQWYTVPLSILTHAVVLGALDRDSAAGDRHAADAAVGDGVRGGAAAAAAAAAATAAAVGAAADRRRRSQVQSERRADRGAEGNQA